MGVQIHVPADQIWEFYKENEERLKSEFVLVAENTDTDYAVYLTDEKDDPVLAAAKIDGEVERKETCHDADSCEETAWIMYHSYLFPITVEKSESNDNEGLDDSSERSDIDDMIYERHDELILAASDFLDAVLQLNDTEESSLSVCGTDMIEDILEGMLESLSENGIPVYRPMFVEDEDGNEVFVEFPYEGG